MKMQTYKKLAYAVSTVIWFFIFFVPAFIKKKIHQWKCRHVVFVNRFSGLGFYCAKCGKKAQWGDNTIKRKFILGIAFSLFMCGLYLYGFIVSATDGRATYGIISIFCGGGLVYYILQTDDYIDRYKSYKNFIRNH